MFHPTYVRTVCLLALALALCPLLAGCGKKDPADRIETGMTESEVDAILGSLPRRVESTGQQTVSVDITSGQRVQRDTETSRKVTYLDEAKGRAIVVWYKDGKVTRKEVQSLEESGSAPPGPPIGGTIPPAPATSPGPGKLPSTKAIPVNPNVTAANFEKITVGMTTLEVGKPLKGTPRLPKEDELPESLRTKTAKVARWYAWVGETHSIYVGVGETSPKDARVLVRFFLPNSESKSKKE